MEERAALPLDGGVKCLKLDGGKETVKILRTLWRALLRYDELLFPSELSDEEVQRITIQMLLEE